MWLLRTVSIYAPLRDVFFMISNLKDTSTGVYRGCNSLIEETYTGVVFVVTYRMQFFSVFFFLVEGHLCVPAY